MSIFDRIREAVVEHDDDEAAATAVYRKVTKADLRALIVRECQHARRTMTSRVERAAFRPSRNPGEVDPLAARQDLLDEEFYADPDRGYVKWGKATVADHEARIAYLKALSAGIEESIARHETALAIIRESDGATCLADVEFDPEDLS